MEIDIKEYLSEDELKDICKERFTESLKPLFSENEIQRIITNTAYNTIYKMVEDSFNQNLEQLLAEKIKSLIEKMTEFNIFKEPNAWDKETNTPFQFKKKCIEEQFPRIKQIISDNIEKQTLSYLKEDIKEHIYNSIEQLFKEVK